MRLVPLGFEELAQAVASGSEFLFVHSHIEGGQKQQGQDRGSQHTTDSNDSKALHHFGIFTDAYSQGQ